jgi:CBS-domain-containing membrane protein
MMRRWTVADVMTRDVVSLAPDVSYREVLDVLMNSGVSSAPVVDAGGHVLGVVSEADLLHKVEAVGDERHRRILGGLRRPDLKTHGATAADLMTAPAVVIEPDALVAAAARTLEQKRIKQMPVVDAEGRLVGIESRRDLLRIHTRPDAEIRADIVDDVLRRTLWIDPLTIQVDVVDGAVSVAGKVESWSLGVLVVKLVAEVAGVVEVVDRLTWDQDDSRAVRSHGYAFGNAERLLRPSSS